MTITLTSQAFRQSGEIPVQHTCESADVSSPLAGSGVPVNAKSLALIVDDPDAPDRPRRKRPVYIGCSTTSRRRQPGCPMALLRRLCRAVRSKASMTSSVLLTTTRVRPWGATAISTDCMRSTPYCPI